MVPSNSSARFTLVSAVMPSTHSEVTCEKHMLLVVPQYMLRAVHTVAAGGCR
jgi:hypothetical protein